MTTQREIKTVLKYIKREDESINRLLLFYFTFLFFSLLLFVCLNSFLLQRKKKNAHEASLTAATISKQVRVWREYVLLGQYDTAIIYFQTMISTISEHANSVPRSNHPVKERWKKVSTTCFSLTLPFPLYLLALPQRS